MRTYPLSCLGLLIFLFWNGSVCAQVNLTTFFGGSGQEDGFGTGITPGGLVILSGHTNSPDLPVSSNAFQDSLSGSYDYFLAAFERDGQLRWATYLGGNSQELGARLTIAKDLICVGGNTSSTDFPISPGTGQTAYAGGGDITCTCFDTLGQMVWSSYFGGSAVDLAADIASDTAGNIIIGGLTNSLDFPSTPGATFPVPSGGSDAFAVRFSQTGQITFATCFGGSGNEDLHALATGPGGSIYITGMTNSSDLPMLNEIQSGLAGNDDVFIARFLSDGSFNWSTYFGGLNSDDGYGMATSPSGELYLAGVTASPDFPVTSGTWTDTLAGAADMFLASFSTSDTLLQCGLMGGNLMDVPTKLRFGNDNRLYISLRTNSVNLPLQGSITQIPYSGQEDGYLLKVKPDFNRIASSYFGDSLFDIIHDLAVDSGFAVISGTSLNPALPFIGPSSFQAIHGGNTDAFLTFFDLTYDIPDTGSSVPSIDRDQWKIYPVPATETVRFEISSPEMTAVKLKVYSMDGRVLLTGAPPTLNVSGLMPGIYLVEIDNGLRKVFRKIQVI